MDGITESTPDAVIDPLNSDKNTLDTIPAARQSDEASISNDLDKLITNCFNQPDGDIEQLNANKSEKINYYQYYNSTIIVDKSKSDEYWANKKEYITSNILSNSYRRAVVSAI